jgi:hypothetical protein
MLPSFRLIAATFLCGFFMVYAGLRLATSLHSFHEAMPVTAAHAMSPAAHDGQNIRPGQTVVPAIYDLRFVSSAASLAPIPGSKSASRPSGAETGRAPAADEFRPAEGNAEAPATKLGSIFVAAINPADMPSRAQEIELPSKPAPDAAAAEQPTRPSIGTAAPDQDTDEFIAKLVDVPLPRPADRPPFADEQAEIKKPTGRSAAAKRRVAEQSPFNQIPNHNIFVTPPEQH